MHPCPSHPSNALAHRRPLHRGGGGGYRAPSALAPRAPGAGSLRPLPRAPSRIAVEDLLPTHPYRLPSWTHTQVLSHRLWANNAPISPERPNLCIPPGQPPPAPLLSLCGTRSSPLQRGTHVCSEYGPEFGTWELRAAPYTKERHSRTAPQCQWVSERRRCARNRHFAVAFRALCRVSVSGRRSGNWRSRTQRRSVRKVWVVWLCVLLGGRFVGV